MIGKVSLVQLAQAIDAELLGENAEIKGSVHIDSRTLTEGQLFLAIRGENFDGHDFVEQAGIAGATACVVDKLQPVAATQLLVKDTQQALLQLARFNRNRFNGTLIGLTGSCGKTTVKEMLASILSQKSAVLATEGNLNNHLGVPLTLCRIKQNHRFAVIEMGTSAPGEIAHLAHLAQPVISILLNAEAAHLEGLKSLEGIAREKGAILDYLPSGSSAVLNFDSPFFPQWRSAALSRGADIISFSLENSRADVYASGICHVPSGVQFLLHCMGREFPVNLSFWGAHQVANACAAVAAALAAEVSIRHIVKGLDAASPYQRRGQRFLGYNDALIIDETYNANPASMQAAIDMLAVCDGERIMVMGDMAELGDEAESIHQRMGEYIRQQGIQQLITFGRLSRLSAKSFGLAAKHFDDKHALSHYLHTCLNAETTVMIKGSNGMKMDEIMHHCKLEKERGV